MNLPFLLLSMKKDRTSQVVSACHMQPESSAFQIISVKYALNSSRSQCWDKEAHTKVEEKSRIEKTYIKNSSDCMMQDRKDLLCVFLRWEVGSSCLIWICV